MDKYFNKLDKIVDWVDYITKENTSKQDFFFCLKWDFFANCPKTLQNHFWKKTDNVVYFKYYPHRNIINFQEFLKKGNPHEIKINYR